MIGAIGIASYWYGGYVYANQPGHLATLARRRDSSIRSSCFSARDILTSTRAASGGRRSHRIFKTLDQRLPCFAGEAAPTSVRAGRIEFRTFGFAYKDEDWVLKDGSFTVEPGTIALSVTPVSRRRSQHRLMRFDDIQRGRYCSMALICVLDCRRAEELAVVRQEVFLFSGRFEAKSSGRETSTKSAFAGRRRSSCGQFYSPFEG